MKAKSTSPVRLLREAIAAKRKARFRQQDLARELGAKQSAISTAENYAISRDLSLKLWERYRDELVGLGMTLEDLLRWRGKGEGADPDEPGGAEVAA